MLLTSVRILAKRSLPKGLIIKYLNTSVNLQKNPKVNFSTTKAVNVEFFEGMISRPLMATPNDSTVTRNIEDYTVKNPDDVWLSKAKQDQFLTYLPDIVNELEAKAATFSALDNGNRIKRIIEYVMPGGCRILGITSVETYKILTPEHKQTQENLKLAYYLAWCFEIVFETLTMVDDVIDVCQTRRNRLCWHNLPDVGSSAVNDMFMLEAGAYYLLREYFGNLDCYARILKIFQEMTFVTCVGQHVHLSVSKNLEKLTFDAYREIILNTAVYQITFAPVAIGMILAGYTDLQALKEANSFLTDISYYYCIQNDFNDCFGDAKLTGKISSDIQEGRCRWPAVVALKLASPEQKEIMKKNFGQSDPECVAKVIDLFTELNIPQIYEDYTKSVYNSLQADIEKIKNGDMRKICEKLGEAAFCSMRNNPLK